ncbi:squalene/phytoene synthase family protein [Aurantimonas aggregata]|uniref:Squalene/phytoene synthase family protein n=1 Tax=Aurantimonas aggregata TaxID=2047720 RepID=A0A6L9MBP7_9HYPH|nr:phytoene/squalene synthase family protein [Aurantimonas aggregata]NDV85110.1 squalene/phytoene synthase family protein [Aurantimonas aggregata]
MNADAAECLRLVETHDRDRALSLAFAPAEARGDLAALYAFNYEVARVREQVSQPLPGEIRLQWWRDTIEGASPGEAAANPVAAALLETIDRHQLPRDAFDRMLEARIFDLYDDPMPSREAYEAYAGETASALIMLASLVLSRDEAGDAANAAGHAGVAQLVAGTLLLLPIHRARGQVFLPGDLLQAAGCTTEELLRGDREPAARAIAAMVALGREHIAAFQSHAAGMPLALRPAFLPAILAARYLDRIEAAGPGALERPVQIAALRKSFDYWRWMRR